MRTRLHAVIACALAAMVAGCGAQDPQATADLPDLSAQTRFLDPASNLVAAVDLRESGPAWDGLRPFVAELLRAAREDADERERLQIPVNLDGALAMLAGFAGVSYEQDVKPVLDGHLVIGLVQPERTAMTDREPSTLDPHAVVVYRTRRGNLRALAEKIMDGATLRPVPGHEDVVELEESAVLVGDDTLLLATGGRPAIRAALERVAAGGDELAERLSTAAADAGVADPLILVSGDTGLALRAFNASELDRARAEVPYVAALERASGALAVDGDGLLARLRAVTDAGMLADEDLPVASAGELSLPKADGIVGAARNQSLTTTFLSRLTRTALEDSRFARRVAEAERELGISFDDEVLRQFDCPSASVLAPPEPGRPVQGFAARSCVRDPEAMRALLPKLGPYLPAILRGLQGLGNRGLAAVLLIAPDAPLTPGALANLASIVVQELTAGPAGEDLYEIAGLHDDPADPIALSGPERVTFGLIGDTFVVASDPDRARAIAEVEVEPLDREAGAAVRAPARVLSGGERWIERALGDVLLTVSADRGATDAELRIPVRR